MSYVHKLQIVYIFAITVSHLLPVNNLFVVEF